MMTTSDIFKESAKRSQLDDIQSEILRHTAILSHKLDTVQAVHRMILAERPDYNLDDLDDAMNDWFSTKLTLTQLQTRLNLIKNAK